MLPPFMKAKSNLRVDNHSIGTLNWVGFVTSRPSRPLGCQLSGHVRSPQHRAAPVTRTALQVSPPRVYISSADLFVQRALKEGRHRLTLLLLEFSCELPKLWVAVHPPISADREAHRGHHWDFFVILLKVPKLMYELPNPRNAHISISARVRNNRMETFSTDHAIYVATLERIIVYILERNGLRAPTSVLLSFWWSLQHVHAQFSCWRMMCRRGTEIGAHSRSSFIGRRVLHRHAPWPMPSIILSHL